MRALWHLALIIAVSTLSYPALSAGPDQQSKPTDVASIGDYFDGLRAWELGEHPTAAVIWLKAAEFGDVRAMLKVAELYEHGDILPRTSTLAYFWFSQAGRRGDGPARMAADRLRSQIPAADSTNLELAIGSWRPKSFPAAAPNEKDGNAGDLFSALEARDLEAFRAYLSQAINEGDLVDAKGTPAIFLAIATKQLEFIRAQLSRFDELLPPINREGLDPNRNLTLSNGMTPLHIAAGLGQAEIVRMLISDHFSTAVQDQDGAWPSDLAERKHFTGIANLLRAQQDIDTHDIKRILEDQGYIAPGGFANPVSRQLAVKMFQQGRFFLTRIGSTGYLNFSTLKAAADESQNSPSIYFLAIARWKKGNYFYYDGFKNKLFPKASDAVSAGQEYCHTESGRGCKVNVTPAGGCMGVAKPTEGGEFTVSRAMLTENEASQDALAQCRLGTSKGCSIDITICVPSN